MATFSSPEVIINQSAKTLFNKIENLNNLKEIMPPQIEKFESNKDSCVLKMKGMPELKLKIGEKDPYNKISLIAQESQIAFSLECYIKEQQEKSQIRLEINAELNMMMEMMARKPLTEFLNILATQIQNI